MPEPDGMTDPAAPNASRGLTDPPSERPATRDQWADDAADRPLGVALRRGWRRRCPACDRAPMLRGYLTVRDICPCCGEALHHHRADDGPAYLTILVVGHVMAPLFLYVFITFRPDPWTMMALFTTGVLALSLYLLPRMKGAMVALQWSRRMHGFGGHGSG